MGMKTGIIRYNLNDRGRRYNGQKRRFNIPAMMRIINGEKIQEQVKSGDLVGYLGHGIRQDYGIFPPEAALHGGQVIPIDPAFKTIYLKAFEDGTVEHEAEFLDTALGQKAQEWFLAKTGGFSSVVYPDEVNPQGFGGFDYVRAPNFNANRGYAMDSAAFDKELERLTSKQKMEVLRAEQEEIRAVMDAVMQSSVKSSEENAMLQTLNRQLSATVDSLSTQLEHTQHQLDDAVAVIDTLQPKHQPMMRLSVGSGDNWLTDAVASFDSVSQGKATAPLAADEELPAYLQY